MIIRETRALPVPTARIVAFFENLDTHYLNWHPDHVSFAWLDGGAHKLFHFDERIGRWRLAMAMSVSRTKAGREAICRPLSRWLRLVFPWMSFVVEDAPGGCRYTHHIKLRVGPFGPLIERTFLVPLRRHMREESAYLAALARDSDVA